MLEALGKWVVPADLSNKVVRENIFPGREGFVH